MSRFNNKSHHDSKIEFVNGTPLICIRYISNIYNFFFYHLKTKVKQVCCCVTRDNLHLWFKSHHHHPNLVYWNVWILRKIPSDKAKNVKKKANKPTN